MDWKWMNKMVKLGQSLGVIGMDFSDKDVRPRAQNGAHFCPLPPSSCAALGNSLPLSGPQLPFCEIEIKIVAFKVEFAKVK